MRSVADIRKFNSETTRFYQEVGESFSATRQHPWEGWQRCKKYLPSGSKVLDIGCGNQRFAKFVPECKVIGIDNTFNADIKLDIVQALLDNNFPSVKCDAAVAFGLMHHIPDYDLRLRLIKYMLEQADIAIITFWQIGEKQLKKVEHIEGEDYYLHWQDRSDVRRFCHNFTNEEVDQVIEDIKINVVDRFVSDNANLYLVARK